MICLWAFSFFPALKGKRQRAPNCAPHRRNERDTTSRNHETNPRTNPRKGESGPLPVFCFFDTEHAACTGITREELLPGAFCVQRFSNGMILQYIPLIALCCVLHRYGKPSHPSRHVLDATQGVSPFLPVCGGAVDVRARHCCCARVTWLLFVFV